MVTHLDEEKPQYTKTGKVRKRKPKTTNRYFTEETEDAILEYVGSQSAVHRNRLFNEKINYAFHKLAENIINNFPFPYRDGLTVVDLKHEVVTVFLEKLHLYKKEKGKAYSYFGTVAKRYLINLNKKNYKKKKEKAPMEDMDNDKTLLADMQNQIEVEQDMVKIDPIDLFINYVETNLSLLFPKERDVKIADAILEIFRKREKLDILSKKALYIYIREITDAPTPAVTVVIKKLKKIYKAIQNRYLEHGYPADLS